MAKGRVPQLTKKAIDWLGEERKLGTENKKDRNELNKERIYRTLSIFSSRQWLRVKKGYPHRRIAGIPAKMFKAPPSSIILMSKGKRTGSYLLKIFKRGMDFDLALSRQASKALLLKRSLRSFTRFPAARSYLTASMIDVYNIWLTFEFVVGEREKDSFWLSHLLTLSALAIFDHDGKIPLPQDLGTPLTERTWSANESSEEEFDGLEGPGRGSGCPPPEPTLKTTKKEKTSSQAQKKDCKKYDISTRGHYSGSFFSFFDDLKATALFTKELGLRAMSYNTYARRKNALMGGYAKEGESLACLVCLEPGLADGNGISGNAVKGEGAKEANSNEESFRGVTPSRKSTFHTRQSSDRGEEAEHNRFCGTRCAGIAKAGMSSQRSNKLLDRLKLKGEREMTLVVEYPEEGERHCYRFDSSMSVSQSQIDVVLKIPLSFYSTITVVSGFRPPERDQSRNSPQPFPYDDSCLARAVRMSYANEFTFGLDFSVMIAFCTPTKNLRDGTMTHGSVASLFRYTALRAERININLSEYEEESEIVVRSLSSNPQMCIFECFSRSPISQYQYFGCSSRYSYLKNELTKRLFTEIVVVSVVARISHDWVGVKSTACLAYALHEHLNVQDKKNEGKNRRGECSRRENRAATIASAGAAIGIGNVLSSSIHSVARNPSLAKQLFGYAILGFALTEAIASFAPMMAFLISFIFQWEEDRWERAEREQSKFQWWAVFAVPFHRLFLGKSRSNRSQGAVERDLHVLASLISFSMSGHLSNAFLLSGLSLPA
ncbi:hypothetical protein KY290_005164 [Solanum tuberosum]|uniref:V-ATPase proteolipid subunit C-like domain-containing protein n=1 Tax=Solanum tuberosum TaxID=4113 RepID=A0ABQ7WDB7_SOLTU|nr:hypothetical protein KY285_005049 [Solanum tuberosum]KAH0778737.1 hypothetical protein KY290_005164 [Solanum tuberosum]